MHGHKDKWIKDRVRWKLKSYDTDFTSEVLFFEEPSCVASALCHAAESRSAGLPIMAFWRSEELWTFLGSEKIVWKRSGEVEELLLDELKWVTGHEMTVKWSDSGIDDLLWLRDNWETLHLNSESGDEHLIWAAPGGWCMAFWNVLLMLIGMQKKTQDGI